jgi:hypothetical protein
MTEKIPYQAPSYLASAFNCPHCSAYAEQSWFDLMFGYYNQIARHHPQGLPSAKVCVCTHCHHFSIWLNNKMIYPNYVGVEPPNPDLNDDIKKDYEEAAYIFQKSPRGAAALLRLAIQKLMKQIGEKGENLNDDISNLVKKGLSKKIQEALDSVRVIGNEAVHPGEMDLRDDVETVRKLFWLVNFIAEKMITEPKEIEKFYSNKIPENKKKAIEDRNERANKQK